MLNDLWAAVAEKESALASSTNVSLSQREGAPIITGDDGDLPGEEALLIRKPDYTGFPVVPPLVPT